MGLSVGRARDLIKEKIKNETEVHRNSHARQVKTVVKYPQIIMQKAGHSPKRIVQELKAATIR